MCRFNAKTIECVHLITQGIECINNYIPRRKSGIYWIQVRRAAAAAAAVEISLWTR